MRVNIHPGGIQVTHSLHNDREAHLGAAEELDSDSDDDDSDGDIGDGEEEAEDRKGGEVEEGDEGDGGAGSEDEGTGDEESAAPPSLTFPHSLAPLFTTLFQAAGSGDNFVSVGDLTAACSAADDAEVHSALALLQEEGLLCTA